MDRRLSPKTRKNRTRIVATALVALVLAATAGTAQATEKVCWVPLAISGLTISTGVVIHHPARLIWRTFRIFLESCVPT